MLGLELRQQILRSLNRARDQLGEERRKQSEGEEVPFRIHRATIYIDGITQQLKSIE